MNQARLIIPDIHHKLNLVEKVRTNHPRTPAIFCDYFDDFDDTVDHMKATCRWLKEALENSDDEFLLGNHCFAYVSYELGVRWGFCTGWRADKQQVFHEYFPNDTPLDRVSWLTQCQDWLISHAGLSNDLHRSFRKRRTIDEIAQWATDAETALRAKVQHPAFLAGLDRGGRQKFGGILWCDWENSSRYLAFARLWGIPRVHRFALGRTTCVLIPISVTMAYLRTSCKAESCVANPLLSTETVFSGGSRFA